MIAAIRTRREPVGVIEEFTTAWERGTGQKVTLEPGEYRITASYESGDSRFVQLDDLYLLDVRQLSRSYLRTVMVPVAAPGRGRFRR